MYAEIINELDQLYMQPHHREDVEFLLNKFRLSSLAETVNICDIIIKLVNDPPETLWEDGYLDGAIDCKIQIERLIDNMKG
jgi:hypothetical protein